MSTRISLAEAQQRLGEDVVIDLEPPDVVAAKLAAVKEGELWVFNPRTGSIRRGDGKFHALRVVRHPGGYNVAAVIEEPSVEAVPLGSLHSPRIVGHVIVDVNLRGLVRVRQANGLNGKILELRPSSISKGELDDSGREPDAIYEANPQRIHGSIAVYRHNVEFDDTEGMTPSAFVAATTDGRSLSAVTKLFFAS